MRKRENFPSRKMLSEYMMKSHCQASWRHVCWAQWLRGKHSHMHAQTRRMSAESEKPISVNPLPFKRLTRKGGVTAVSGTQASTPQSVTLSAHRPLSPCLSRPAWPVEGQLELRLRENHPQTSRTPENPVTTPTHWPPPSDPTETLLGAWLICSRETDRQLSNGTSLWASLRRPGHAPGRRPGENERRTPEERQASEQEAHVEPQSQNPGSRQPGLVRLLQRARVHSHPPPISGASWRGSFSVYSVMSQHKQKSKEHIHKYLYTL